MNTEPTIKGIFVMSHVKALEALKGGEVRAELEKRYGKKINFKNSEDVPIREEVKIIEHALDLSSETQVPFVDHARVAGHLHFKNFSGTPLGRMVLPFFKTQFKLVLMNANNVAGHVFRGVTFKPEEKSANSVVLVMGNNDYPLGHFQGFFEAWMEYSGLSGTVSAEDRGGNTYAYTITWNQKT